MTQKKRVKEKKAKHSKSRDKLCSNSENKTNPTGLICSIRSDKLKNQKNDVKILQSRMIKCDDGLKGQITGKFNSLTASTAMDGSFSSIMAKEQSSKKYQTQN